MKHVVTLCTFALLLVTSCNGTDPPPPPPPPPPETCELWSAPDGCECPEGTEVSHATGLCSPPRVDRTIDWNLAAGGTSFSLALRDAKFIDEWARWHRDHGWPVLRVGAQTSYDWCNAAVGYLPCGPEHGTDEWRANLVRLLDVTARRENVWLQLIPTFTYKSHNAGSQAANIAYFSAMFDRVNRIVLEGGYKHVIWEAFNEVVHPLSQHIKDEDVLAILEHMKENTYLPVGTDYHGGLQSVDVQMFERSLELSFSQGEMTFERRFALADRLYQRAMREMEWRGRYPYIWRDVVDYIAFHTIRNPEPTLERMQEAQAKFKYNKPVLIDETVSWASQENIDRYGLAGKGTIAMEGRGTEDERMWQCVSHLKDIHNVKNQSGLRWRPFFHSIWQIESAEMGRIPTYSTDIEK